VGATRSPKGDRGTCAGREQKRPKEMLWDREVKARSGTLSRIGKVLRVEIELVKTRTSQSFEYSDRGDPKHEGSIGCSSRPMSATFLTT
jgi:hypothetical protein